LFYNGPNNPILAPNASTWGHNLIYYNLNIIVVFKPVLLEPLLEPLLGPYFFYNVKFQVHFVV